MTCEMSRTFAGAASNHLLDARKATVLERFEMQENGGQ